MPRWKPLDTAPKDGTPVLLFLPASDGYWGHIEDRYAVASWIKAGFGGAWLRETGSSWTHDGCVRSGAVWQPLPKPPATSEA